MLQVVAMAFCNLSVDSLLDPCNLINKPNDYKLILILLVAELLKEVKSKAVLGVNDPNEEKAVLLD